MTTANSARVLVIGLDPYRVPGPWDPEPVAQEIAVGLARFADHAVPVTTCLLGLDGSDDVASRVRSALDNGPYACVVIGGGLRHSDETLPLFETVINLVHQHAPGAAIAFNRTPQDTYDAAARWLA